MLGTTTEIPGNIGLIADHLDAALAAGEDLLALKLAPAADLAASEDDPGAGLRDLVAMAVRHEATILAHVLQARRRSDDLARQKGPLRALSKLFAANTAGLLDIVAQHGDRVKEGFDGGADPIVFLRKRGVLAESQAGLSRFTGLAIPEHYRIGGAVELGPLLDLVSSFLDVLDQQFDLYPAEPQEAVEAVAEPERPADGAVIEVEDAASAADRAAVAQKSLVDALAELQKGTEH
jgi:hypothetical protein